jgi:hypothetical protein
MRLYPGDIGMEPRLDPPDEGPWCVECGNEWAEAKEYVCAGCAIDLFQLTGERITSGEHLAAYIAHCTSPEVVKLGIEKCFYPNAVDATVAQVLAGGGS